MNVASLELCKELRDASGWDGTVWYHWKGKLWTSGELRGMTVAPDNKPLEAYDAGYLLRKLPPDIESGPYPGRLANLWVRKQQDKGEPEKYFAWYFVVGIVDGTSDVGVHAASPEDALAKLAIELFKAGVLKREEPNQRAEETRVA